SRQRVKVLWSQARVMLHLSSQDSSPAEKKRTAPVQAAAVPTITAPRSVNVNSPAPSLEPSGAGRACRFPRASPSPKSQQGPRLAVTDGPETVGLLTAGCAFR